MRSAKAVEPPTAVRCSRPKGAAVTVDEDEDEWLSVSRLRGAAAGALVSAAPAVCRVLRDEQPNAACVALDGADGDGSTEMAWLAADAVELVLSVRREVEALREDDDRRMFAREARRAAMRQRVFTLSRIQTGLQWANECIRNWTRRAACDH